MGATASPTRVRFGVLGFVCGLSLLTYLDRVCISRVSGAIRTDLHIDDVQMGLVFGAFAVGYGLFEVPGGWMGDVWGPRRVLTRIVLWWSVFTALTGCVWPFALELGPLVLNSLVALLVVRFLFGCGEAGAYPNVTRVVGSWFPYRERGLAQGGVWMSARLGGALAPLAIGGLARLLGGWRQAFWALGGIGLAWALIFTWWFRDRPEDKPGCNDAERDLIRAGPYSMKADEAGHAHPMPPWSILLRSGTLWALCVAGACVSFGWYFFPTWQPDYFKQVHHITDDKHFEVITGLPYLEVVTGLPFFFGAFGALAGGSLSDWLVRRLGSRRWGRSLVGIGGFVGAGVCVALTGLAQTAWVSVALLCLAFFINDLAIPPIWACSTDIGGRYAGTVAGIMNMMGAVGAFLGPVLTPVFKAIPPEGAPYPQQWAVVFAILASAWFVGAVAWLFVNAGKPLIDPAAPQPPAPAG
jgi:MFS family permease